MPPGEFREWGRRFVDWVADYLEEVERHPVLSTVEPGQVRRGLAAEAPDAGEPMEALFEDFKSVVVPGITHWNHPAFFAYFAVSGSGPGILGELLAAALNVNAMVWRTSPAATELEQVTLEWLRGLVGLPPSFTGTINDTASVSTFHALAAAREMGLPEARASGLAGAPPGRIYATSETHSSIAKAVHALGLGRDGLRAVATGPGRGMDPAALVDAIDRDAASGSRPLAVVATIGTTSVAAVDPVDAIADVAAARGLWLHVDAAYAGPAAALPRLRSHFRGWERADSIVINPHKWLFTPIDCSALYLRDPQGIEHHHWAVHDWSTFFDGDPSEWTAYTETVVLPRGSAPGTWGLAEMTVWDKAGNIHRYDFTEIVHVDLDCETEGQMSAEGRSNFSAVLVAAVTKVPCLPTFEVSH